MISQCFQPILVKKPEIEKKEACWGYSKPFFVCFETLGNDEKAWFQAYLAWQLESLISLVLSSEERNPQEEKNLLFWEREIILS